MAVATPVLTWVAAVQPGIAVGNSGSYTFNVDITQQWAMVVPVIVRFPTNVSAGPQVLVYRSTDGGTSYDTVALTPLGLARQSGGFQQVSVKLETGNYAVQVLVGGGSTSTWTVQVLTAQCFTGILNA